MLDLSTLCGKVSRMNLLLEDEEIRDARQRADDFLDRVEAERAARVQPLQMRRDRAAQIGLDNLRRLQRVFDV